MKLSLADVNLTIDVPEYIKKVGLKISGGIESSLLAFLLSIYKRDFRSDLEIYSITCISSEGKYHGIVTHNVLNLVENLTNVKFDGRFYKQINSDFYVDDQYKFTQLLLNVRLIDGFFYGENKNPPITSKEITDGPSERYRDYDLPVQIGKDCFRPFINLDKKQISKIYDHYGLRDTLLPITRSCEFWTPEPELSGKGTSHIKMTHIGPHCGKCWNCKERKWAFDDI